MSRQMPASLSAVPAETFEPKTLFQKARHGLIPAYPWGEGPRKTWRFKISQLDEWMKSKLHSPRRPPFSERRGFQ